MRTKSTFLILCLLTGATSFQLSAQDEENHRLKEFVGEYTHSISVKQPGVNSFLFGKAKIQLIDPNTINAEFSAHDIEFVIEYNPSEKVYLFTYVLKQSGVIGNTEPLFSLNKIELVYSEEAGYTHKETHEEEEWTLEVTIKTEDDNVNCAIKSIFEGKTFEHGLNFWPES